MAVTTLKHALLIHALAAPVIFSALAFLYFRRFHWLTPLRTAVIFLAVIIVMDFCVVAVFIERSFAMFTSVLGTWLPFLLIFLATWWTGVAVRRAVNPAST